ncbi:DLL3 [Auxenochlorella protothecoides x Auxenochlorella symbiontica]
MAEADQQEAIEICSAIVDKHGAEVERCTHAIRDGLAKHFGAGNWQVVMGQAFCYSISHEVNQLICFYPAEKLAILAWKA